MNPDFIRINGLEGELKLAQIKSHLGCLITTKEMVFQKPHTSYHLLLDDITGIIPFAMKQRTISLQIDNHTLINANFGDSYYKISATKMKVYRRSGVEKNGFSQVIVQLGESFLQYIAQYSNLTVIQESQAT